MDEPDDLETLKRLLWHLDATWLKRQQALDGLQEGWALKSSADRADNLAFKKAHQDFMECVMSFWPRIRPHMNLSDEL